MPRTWDPGAIAAYDQLMTGYGQHLDRFLDAVRKARTGAGYHQGVTAMAEAVLQLDPDTIINLLITATERLTRPEPPGSSLAPLEDL